MSKEIQKTFIHKNRFFIEDDNFESVDYFSASISKEGFANGPNYWVQLDIGGSSQYSGVSWGFSINGKEERQDALKHFCNLYIGIKNLYEDLQKVCQELDKEKKDD